MQSPAAAEGQKCKLSENPPASKLQPAENVIVDAPRVCGYMKTAHAARKPGSHALQHRMPESMPIVPASTGVASNKSQPLPFAGRLCTLSINVDEVKRVTRLQNGLRSQRAVRAAGMSGLQKHNASNAASSCLPELMGAVSTTNLHRPS